MFGGLLPSETSCFELWRSSVVQFLTQPLNPRRVTLFPRCHCHQCSLPSSVGTLRLLSLMIVSGSWHVRSVSSSMACFLCFDVFMFDSSSLGFAPSCSTGADRCNSFLQQLFASIMFVPSAVACGSIGRKLTLRRLSSLHNKGLQTRHEGNLETIVMHRNPSRNLQKLNLNIRVFQSANDPRTLTHTQLLSSNARAPVCVYVLVCG